jgi:hypothetical protein
MASKRKSKRTAQPRDDLSRPTKWRLQHGAFSDLQRDADPQTGTPVAHRRAIDTLGAMLANGTITDGMHDAGVRFRSQFRAAALDTLTAMPMLRVPGGTGDPLVERQLAARDRVAAVMGVLGGPDSAAGSCVWHVVGLEWSVREWAMRQGWGGRSVPASQAQGMLVSALCVLAGHDRLGARGQAA